MGEYDFRSIMHYPLALVGTPTAKGYTRLAQQHTAENEVGGFDDLSEDDIRGLAALYGPPAQQAGETVGVSKKDAGIAAAALGATATALLVMYAYG